MYALIILANSLTTAESTCDCEFHLDVKMLVLNMIPALIITLVICPVLLYMKLLARKQIRKQNKEKITHIPTLYLQLSKKPS